MAGRGPAPKKHNQRGTDNWTRLEPLDEPVLSELTGNHTPLAKLHWDAWRLDPVTATWTATEIALAHHLVELIDSDPVGKAPEIRLRIDGLALSPKGRRDARLLLPEEDAPDGESLPEPTPLRVLPEAK